MKNIQICADKGRLGAVCDWWPKKGPVVKYPKDEWDEERFAQGMACTKFTNLTSMMAVIKKLCFDSGRCSFEEYKAAATEVRRLFRRLGYSTAELDSITELPF